MLGNLLRAEGIDTLIVERASREQAQTRARAGFLGPNSARVLTQHGLGAGMIHKGRSHGVCAFRGEDGEFELDYSRLGRGEVIEAWAGEPSAMFDPDRCPTLGAIRAWDPEPAVPAAPAAPAAAE